MDAKSLIESIIKYKSNILLVVVIVLFLIFLYCDKNSETILYTYNIKEKLDDAFYTKLADKDFSCVGVRRGILFYREKPIYYYKNIDETDSKILSITTTKKENIKSVKNIIYLDYLYSSFSSISFDYKNTSIELVLHQYQRYIDDNKVRIKYLKAKFYNKDTYVEALFSYDGYQTVKEAEKFFSYELINFITSELEEVINFDI